MHSSNNASKTMPQNSIVWSTSIPNNYNNKCTQNCLKNYASNLPRFHCIKKVIRSIKSILYNPPLMLYGPILNVDIFLGCMPSSLLGISAYPCGYFFSLPFISSPKKSRQKVCLISLKCFFYKHIKE